MLSILRPYLQIEPHIRNVLYADFFIQLINSSFFLLLNYFLVDNGYADYDIADFVSYRFLAVMLFAFPLGIFIRGRKMKPLFYIASILTPIFSLAIIYAIDHRLDNLIYTSLALWGIAYSCMQVPALPFILSNGKKETHTEAIVVFFLTNSTSIALCGILNFILKRYFSDVFDEKLLLQCFAVMGFFGIYFVHRINIKETTDVKMRLSNFIGHYDWRLILKALFPTLIIATGAGLTIPFINLFFLNVHNMQADAFSLLGSVTFFIVAISVTMVPAIKRKMGYGIAVTLVQSISVFALVMLALTEFYSQWTYAVYLAGLFYVIRQPLMNVAAPVTSELSMYFVGRRNRELMSAINSSIWSGSWFISSQLFGWMRASGISYAGVFFITALLYSLGVFLYHLLIKEYLRRKSQGLTEEE